MDSFLKLINDLDRVTGSSDKIAAMARYLETAPGADGGWAIALLSGRRRRRFLSSGALRAAFRRQTTLPDWLVDDAQAQVGDTGETISLLVAGGHLRPDANGRPDPEAATRSLATWCEQTLPTLASAEDAERDEQLLGWWRSLPPDHGYVLHKLITGGFRLGVARGSVARAVAQAGGVSREAATEFLTGPFDPRADWRRALEDQAANPGQRPYPFFLASPLTDDVAINPIEWRAEWKWDGIRAQLIVRGGEAAIWSRGEEPVAEQFPEIVEALHGLPDGSVLDAELLAMDDTLPAPFHRLQRRLGRKKVSVVMQRSVPVAAIVFDCLEHNGIDLRAQPLEDRLAARDELLDNLGNRLPAAVAQRLKPSPEVPFTDTLALEQLRQSSADSGSEGLMLKRRGSVYGQGRRRGDWWKFKRDPMTLDAVLIYAQAGSGRRANLFTDYTFALRDDTGDLVPFAKAYSGLNDREIGELDRWIRQHTIERFGPVRSVQPERVFEIAFEGIGPSSRHKSGIATRFPRISRARPDKGLDDIDTLETARALIP